MKSENIRDVGKQSFKYIISRQLCVLAEHELLLCFLFDSGLCCMLSQKQDEGKLYLRWLAGSEYYGNLAVNSE